MCYGIYAVPYRIYAVPFRIYAVPYRTLPYLAHGRRRMAAPYPSPFDPWWYL